MIAFSALGESGARRMGGRKLNFMLLKLNGLPNPIAFSRCGSPPDEGGSHFATVTASRLRDYFVGPCRRGLLSPILREYNSRKFLIRIVLSTLSFGQLMFLAFAIAAPVSNEVTKGDLLQIIHRLISEQDFFSLEHIQDDIRLKLIHRYDFGGPYQLAATPDWLRGISYSPERRYIALDINYKKLCLSRQLVLNEFGNYDSSSMGIAEDPENAPISLYYKLLTREVIFVINPPSNCLDSFNLTMNKTQ